MKNKIFFVFFGKKTSFIVLLLAIVSVSCKKEEPVKAEVIKETSKIVNTVSDSLMIKFISITEGVRKEDVTYDKATNEFVVYGINRMDRVFLEAFYKDANIYHMKYGD